MCFLVVKKMKNTLIFLLTSLILSCNSEKKAEQTSFDFYPNVKMDSLQISVTNGTYSKKFVSKLKTLKEADSLDIENKTGSVLAFRNAFVLKSTTPITAIDESKIVLRSKDSTTVKFTSKYIDFEQEIVFDFEKKECLFGRRFVKRKK